jgi:hypothetical protein
VSRRKQPYRIEYSPLSKEHLARLGAAQRALVLDGVDVQLAYQPTTVTRNRRAVGIKDRDRVFIGGEEIKLS